MSYIQFATCDVSMARRFLKKIYKSPVPEELFDLISREIKKDKIRIMDPNFHGSAISKGKNCSDEEWCNIVEKSLTPFNTAMINLEADK